MVQILLNTLNNLQSRRSQLRPPPLFFQEKKVLKPSLLNPPSPPPSSLKDRLYQSITTASLHVACGLIQYGLFTCWKFRFVFHLWLQAVYLSFSTLCSNTVEPPVSDHPKCKGLVVAYESRTARAKFLSQTRIEWYTYSRKIMKVYFPLPITGSFIDKIVCYSM